MQRTLIAILLWSIAAAVRADAVTDAAALLDHCVDLDPRQAVGVEALEKQCPGVWRAIDALGYARYISDDQYESLSVDGIADLLLLRRYFEAGAQSPETPDVAALGRILEELKPPVPQKSVSRWEKFTRWLRDLFGRKREAEEKKESWFERWLNGVQISEKAARIIVYSIVGLVVLTALAIIINEMRVAGVFRRRRKSDAAAPATPAPARPRSAWDEFNDADLRDQPTLLLRLLVERLVAHGRLTRDRSLTHRELTQRVGFEDMHDREVFGAVARLSERSIYGDGVVDDGQLQPVLAQGRSLYDSLTDTGARGS